MSSNHLLLTYKNLLFGSNRAQIPYSDAISVEKVQKWFIFDMKCFQCYIKVTFWWELNKKLVKLSYSFQLFDRKNQIMKWCLFTSIWLGLCPCLRWKLNITSCNHLMKKIFSMSDANTTNAPFLIASFSKLHPSVPKSSFQSF